MIEQGFKVQQVIEEIERAEEEEHRAAEEETCHITDEEARCIADEEAHCIADEEANTILEIQASLGIDRIDLDVLGFPLFLMAPSEGMRDSGDSTGRESLDSFGDVQ
jgi:hypothetical protein